MSASRIVCWLTGKHARSRKHARTGADGHLRSHCTRCGKPLIRTMKRGARVWRVDRSGVNASDFMSHAGEARDRATDLDR